MKISTTNKRILFTVIAIVAVTVLALYSYFIDSTQFELAPKCFLYQLTGYKCPGCGTQRALHELSHLNIAAAWRYNPLLLVAIPVIAILFYFSYFGGKERFPKAAKVLYNYRFTWAVFAVIVAYWVLRNVFDF